MRNLKPKRQKSRTFRTKFVRFEDIQKVIDAKTFDKEKAFSLLQKVRISRLKPFHLVQYYYLNVRFHFRCFKHENALEHLELANDLLDQMDKIAYEHKVKIRKSSYHFTRAYIKFLTSKLSFDEFTSPFQLAKAKRITSRALEFEPNSSTFLWLNKQLSA